MNKFKKALALICCAVLLVCISVGATLAYLFAQTEVVENTFTVGDIKLNLDEADVDLYGKLVGTENDRVLENDYKLLPGHTYIKDPTVTVLAKSEDAYVRAKVTVSDINALKSAFTKENYPTYYNGDLFLLQNLVSGWSNNVWQYQVDGYKEIEYTVTDENGNAKVDDDGNEIKATSATYEFWYVGSKVKAGTTYVPYATTDTVLEDIFTHVVIPGDINNEDLAKVAGVKINVIAEAIQADTLADATTAWDAFDEQMK